MNNMLDEYVDEYMLDEYMLDEYVDYHMNISYEYVRWIYINM